MNKLTSRLKLNDVTGEVRDEIGATFCYIAQSGYKNAEFLIKAANCHHELLEALRAMIDMATDSRTHGPEIDKACEAIKRAES